MEVEFHDYNRARIPLKNPHEQLGETDFAALLAADPHKTSFIDKSLMIKAFLEKGNSRRVLVTAPRRFGKTINLQMLRHFFDINFRNNWKVFDLDMRNSPNYKMFYKYDLNIIKEAGLVSKHFGRYPVISVSFKCESSIGSYWEAMQFSANSIKDAYKKYSHLLLPTVVKSNIDWWCNVVTSTLTENDKSRILYSLKTLIEVVSGTYEKNVVLLVDDYDSVILQMMRYVSTREELKGIIQDTMAILKYAINMNCVEYVFMTGTSHISDMALSSLNVEVCKFLHNHQFVEFFGLTEEEGERLLTETYRLSTAHVKIAKQRYGSYESLNGEKMYSMWSLLQFAKKPEDTENTWVDTGTALGLEGALKCKQIETYMKIEMLGNSCLKIIPQGAMTIDDLVQLSDLYNERNSEDLRCNPSVYFNFLLDQGYLTFVNGQKYELRIPNYEITTFFCDKMLNFLAKDDYTVFENIEDIIRDVFTKIFAGNYVFIEFNRCLQGLMPKKQARTNIVSLYRFALLLASYRLGFQYGSEYFYKVKNEKTEFADFVMVKQNLALIFKIGSCRFSALDQLLINHRQDWVRHNITDYVLIGVNDLISKHCREVVFKVFHR